MVRPSEKTRTRGSTVGADKDSDVKRDVAKREAEASGDSEASTGKKILIGVATSVSSALVIALAAGFVVGQKKDIIESLQTELNKVKEELSGQILREQSDRKKLVVALREAGVNLPLVIILEQIADDANPELVHELVQEIVAQAPVIETKKGYESLIAKSASEGAVVPIFSTSVNGTRLLAFSHDASSLRGIEPTNISVWFRDAGVRPVNGRVLGTPEQLLTTPGVRVSYVAQLRSNDR